MVDRVKPLIAILIDAFRYDYISKEYTPFLHSLTKKYKYSQLRPIIGYSDSIRATIFTGVYPQDHDYWMFYKFSPDSSPFKNFNKLKLIERFPEVIKRVAKIGVSLTYCKYRARKLGYKKLSLQNFPLNVIGYFDYTLKEDMLSSIGSYKTVFNILQKNNIECEYIDSTNPLYLLRHPLSQKKYLLNKIKKVRPETKFLFIYLHHLDMLAHRLGTNSQKFKKVLKEMDMLLEILYKELSEKFNSPSVIIFSDHGMADARSFVNFNSLLKDNGFGKDYLIALDSTMVRIWYLKEKGYRIKEHLERLNYGRFLSEKELIDLKIKFNNRWYFDSIYLISPPYNIYPNFTSLLKPYAMHAYHPDLESQKGIAIFCDIEVIRKNLVELVDFMPTILDYLGIRKPKYLRGESLLS